MGSLGSRSESSGLAPSPDDGLAIPMAIGFRRKPSILRIVCTSSPEVVAKRHQLFAKQTIAN